MKMRSALSLVLAIMTVAAFGEQAIAQIGAAPSVQGGYGFGLGFDYGAQDQRCHGSFGRFSPFGGVIISPIREDLPYFAKFPPVHYSGIVPRPYGISPYAAPPGIVPVEMLIEEKTEPTVIKNPFYDQASDVRVQQRDKEQNENRKPQPAAGKKSASLPGKSARAVGFVRVVNPFFSSVDLAIE